MGVSIRADGGRSHFERKHTYSHQTVLLVTLAGVSYTQGLIVSFRVVDLKALATLRQKDSRGGFLHRCSRKPKPPNLVVFLIYDRLGPNSS